MSTITRERSIAAEDMPPPDDPFYYGWRTVRRTRPDGTEYTENVALTRWDTLHPEEGDHVVESSLNGLIRFYLAGVFRARLADVPDALVLSDVRVDWDHPDLEHHSPDVCAIFGVKEQRDNEWPSFDVAEQGTRPRVIVEIVSPNVRKNDVKDKFAEYHLAEVPCYIIIDRERLGGPWILKGYTRTPAGYVPMTPDARGRLWLPDLKLWLGVMACESSVTTARRMRKLAITPKSRDTWSLRSCVPMPRRLAPMPRRPAPMPRGLALTPPWLNSPGCGASLLPLEPDH